MGENMTNRINAVIKSIIRLIYFLYIICFDIFQKQGLSFQRFGQTPL